jgi:4-hydroxy-tetrahydrodipicolinate synthase
MEDSMFHGSIVALITPFKDGKVDEAAYQSLVEWQINEGTHGLVPCGTTGETVTMSVEEQKRVITLCIEAAAGRVPIMAGTGTSSTEKTIEMTRFAKKAGADAALVVAPYYNKPNQEGIYQHFKAVNEAVDLPIFVYNVPGRTVVDVADATLARLARLPNIAGVKDATADMARALKTRMNTPDDFCMLSGDDATQLAYLTCGGVGCITVTGDVAPRLVAELHNTYRAGDLAMARQIQMRLMPLHDALFCEPNPAPAKFAVSIQGRCRNELRLPLVPIAKTSEAIVCRAMESAGLTFDRAA